MADTEAPVQLQDQQGEQLPVKEKKIIAQKVNGTVKWFNVKNGYGFINREDNKEDIFVHQSAIIKNNPNKYKKSVGEGETVVFDIVQGEKGNEAANVTGPNGEPVQGSKYAADRRQGVNKGGRSRQFYRRNQGSDRRNLSQGGDSQTRQGGEGGAPQGGQYRPRRYIRIEDEDGEQQQQRRGGYRGRPRFRGPRGGGFVPGGGRPFRPYRRPPPPNSDNNGEFQPPVRGGYRRPFRPRNDEQLQQGGQDFRPRRGGFRGGNRGGFRGGRGGGFRGGRGGPRPNRNNSFNKGQENSQHENSQHEVQSGENEANTSSV